MTSHMPKATPRKRLLLFTILSSVILVVAWITYFLVNFDLNDYRHGKLQCISCAIFYHIGCAFRCA